MIQLFNAVTDSLLARIYMVVLGILVSILGAISPSLAFYAIKQASKEV